MRAARRHGWTAGAVPLGYMLADKKLVPNETEVEHVRWLYQTYLAQYSLTRTIDAATKRGLLAKNGKPLTKNTLRHILANPVYIGKQSAGDEVVEGQHEAILDASLWEAVNAQLRANHNDGGARTRNRYGALLRGSLTCAVCGSPMHQTAGGGHAYYACRRLLKESASACPGSRVPVAVIETAVVERIRAIGRGPALVEATLAAANAAHSARIPELEADAKRIEQRAATNERERANPVKALAQGLERDVAQVDAELIELFDAAQAVRDELALLRAHQIDEDELRRLLADFDAL